jgi:hypothetical protein
MLVVVLVGLCFSVGEGLRLLPLPFTPSGHDVNADSSPGVSSLDAAGQHRLKSGSLGLPPQAQKNLQHKQTHCAPPSGCVLPLPLYAQRPLGEERRAGRALNASVPGPSGRAPPRAA